jgi:hypothetical protein
MVGHGKVGFVCGSAYIIRRLHNITGKGYMDKCIKTKYLKLVAVANTPVYT